MKDLESMSQADIAGELWNIYHDLPVMDLAQRCLSLHHVGSDVKAITVSVAKNRAAELTDEVMEKAAVIKLEERLDKAVSRGA